MLKYIKWIILSCHRIAAAGPIWVARGYMELIGSLSRSLPAKFGARIRDNIRGSKVSWPDLRLRNRAVVVGRDTRLRLFPHLHEFDDEALFVDHLTYEASIFRWLETEAPARYDTIIEIGANVGIYSVVFDRLSRQAGSRIKRIVSFEPSREAYRRLTENLNANSATNVLALPIAIGVQSGIQMFYEPKGHLTNGSFIREFASDFSSEISAVPVFVLAAQALDCFFGSDTRVLIKIDAEGYEPNILDALGQIISTYGPDLIIEVLPSTEEALEACSCLREYRRFLLAEDGPVPHARMQAFPSWRDWLLQPATSGPV